MSAEAPAAFRPSGNRAVGGTVLIVEDEHSIGALIRSYLSRDGYGVVWVRSGEEALVELVRHSVRIVVLDIGLPGMDGFAVAEQLADDVPVIVVTGDPLKAKMRAFGRSPSLTILAKPVTPEQFEAAVQAAL